MIDLQKAYEQNNAIMESRSLLKSVLEELYPNNRKEIDAILAVYDEGFYLDIAENKDFYKAPLNKLLYAQMLIDHYDMNESDALTGLKSWYVFYHGKELIVPSEEEILLIDGNAKDYELREFENGELEIVKFLGFDTEIMTIPNIIDGRRVAALGDDAYHGCRYVKRIIIPEGIEIIGKGCFASCLSLESIQLPQSLKNIPDSAFYFCDSLKEVKMGNQIMEIGNYAFQSCYQLKEITIPDSVEEIGDFAFDDCENLSKIMIGDHVSSIGQKAFRNCGSLNYIRIPSSVKKIGEKAFDDCGIATIELNTGLTEIGLYAFSKCVNLTKIELPSTLTKIDKPFIRDCDNLKEITFKEGLEEIDIDIYVACFSLKRVYLPKTLKIIQAQNLGHGDFDRVTIYCHTGSVALQYAKEHGYRYIDASRYAY